VTDESGGSGGAGLGPRASGLGSETGSDSAPESVSGSASDSGSGSGSASDSGSVPASDPGPVSAAESEPVSPAGSEPVSAADPASGTDPRPEDRGPRTDLPEARGPKSDRSDLPSPQEAALEAARIVSQMVDIHSGSGAFIAAAAAAGAAIEAAREAAAATQKADPPAAPGELHAAQQAPADPITTVRLSRDRILRALAEDEPASRDSSPRLPRAPRARTEPGDEHGEAAGSAQRGSPEEEQELDPVAIAAAAVGRLRARARTDFAELRVHYHRHDVIVLVLAFVIIVFAGRVHERLVRAPTTKFEERGLTFAHSTLWLRGDHLPPPSPRIYRSPSGLDVPKDDHYFHIELLAVGSTARLEVQIDRKPEWSNIVTGLELDRRTRWGELYTLDDSSVRSIAGHDWLRTVYRYAHVPEKGDVPRIDPAVEYATIDRDQIYVVTLFGSTAEIARAEGVVAPSLRVPSRTGLPLVPQTSRLSQRKFPGPVGRAFDSTVMVVVADLVNGRLRARGGGSGVIVGGEGSILTNYHVIHDRDGHLHDVFLIGRFSAPDRAPQLMCAGRPERSKLQPEEDLALIKCDTDLDGRAWSPLDTSIWPTLPEARAADIKMGQRLWVLGYPDVGGGGLTLSIGEVEGWTGEDRALGRDFIKTNASITHGNSGGPVVDDQGRLVGVAAAFRTRISTTGATTEIAQIGLVRPLQAASNLLAWAAAGWTPREGYTEVELTPTAVEPAAEGVRIYTTVLDDANENPIRDATVLVLRPGIGKDRIDMNRLSDQAIAYGKTNALGEVRLRQLVPPGTYTVMVIASGYEPLIGEGELRVDGATPQSFDPWGRIGLRSR
jgi:S1-C subfamily serine protease